ncbi:MAG: response regulator [Alphaproteobacteria bacterium]|nr:response regulator [Alphaproteobacteria bacterium]
MTAYNFSRLTVLVADSNRHMRTVATQILRGFGMARIIETDDGADAFTEMRMSVVDFVICDWMMEPLDGYDFTKLVRTAKDSPNPFVPIVMLTGHTEAYRVMQARDAGTTEFLAKPVSAQTLYRRLVSIIEHPRPFIRAAGFTGPERRRRKNAARTGDERRAVAAPKAGLSPTEVEALMRR